jgi:hemoglobin
VGGTPWFTALVARFFEGVASDPVLRPFYPEDLDGPRERLTGFLIQYWGGPTDYSDQRGHPRLRMRHARFVIDPAAAAAWNRLMAESVRDGNAEAEDEAAMLTYFADTTNFLVNSA